MTFLIDGYNLMHFAGLAPAKVSARTRGLERARTRFVDWLAESLGDRPEVLRVVFDAKAAPAESPESDHHGVRVRFSFGRTADELIEELVAAAPRPDRVTVVSDDNQVRESGRRRGCRVFGCGEFTDWLIAGRPAPAPQLPNTEKPVADATPDELAAWLATFSQPKKRQ